MLNLKHIFMKNQNLNTICKTIRTDIIKSIASASSGHLGGSLSAVEILTTLYFEEMNIVPYNPNKQDRDRFVLSKGHAAPVLYANLSNRGFFSREELINLRSLGSKLQGHPNMNYVPGVDMSTGSLGQGISTAVGMALGNKIDNSSNRVYCLLGDGELEEGQVWEAAMCASHYKLDNLLAIVDFNGLQIDGNITDVMNPTPIDEKFKAFGWNVLTVDGHDIDALLDCYEEAKNFKGAPTVIIARTIKGKGVSFMENQAGWHGAAPNKEQVELALKEIEEAL